MQPEGIYLLVSAGRVPSSGYRVNFLSIEIKGDQLLVFLEFQKPHPRSRQRRVLCYPMALAIWTGPCQEEVVFEYLDKPGQLEKNGKREDGQLKT